MLTRPSVNFAQAVLRFLRQLAVLLVLLISIMAALFLNIFEQTLEVLNPPSLTVRYNAMLADLYAGTDDWQVIHHIEREINTDELSGDAREQFTNQLWKNYLRSPEEYRALSYIDMVEAALAAREEEFHTILRDRARYVADTVTVLDYPENISDPQRTESLVDLLEALEAEINATQFWLDADKGTAVVEVPREPINLKAGDSLQRTLAGAQEILARGIPYPSLTPRYQPIVYESYRRVRNESLVEFSHAVLLDRREDPTLRLMAADYLRQYGDRELLIEQLYQLLADAQEAGAYVQGDAADTPQEGIFARGLLDVLRRTVLEEEGLQQP